MTLTEKINRIEHNLIFVDCKPGVGTIYKLSKLKNCLITRPDVMVNKNDVATLKSIKQNNLIIDELFRASLEVQNEFFKQIFDGYLSNKKIIITGDLESPFFYMDSVLLNKLTILIKNR